MATTISFPTAVTTNGATFSNTFADDGTNTTGTTWASEADIDLSSFSSLSIPGGATINGIEILGEGLAKIPANTPHMAVYNGSSWSSFVACTGTFGRSESIIDPSHGSSSDLWGLAWNATTAAAIQIKFDSSTIGAGYSGYWDYWKVRITYTAAAAAVMAKVNNVTDANISRVIGKPNAEMAKINGITDTD